MVSGGPTTLEATVQNAAMRSIRLFAGFDDSLLDSEIKGFAMIANGVENQKRANKQKRDIVSLSDNWVH